jgi:hypothetical protein
MGILSEVENAATWLDGLGGGVTASGSADLSSHNGTTEAHVHGYAQEHVQTGQTTAHATEHVNLDAVYHDTHNFDFKGDFATQFEVGSNPAATPPPADTGKGVFDQMMHPEQHEQHPTSHLEQPTQEQHPTHHIPDYMSHPHHVDAFSGPSHEHHGPDTTHHDSTHDSHSGSHSQHHGDPGHI